MANRIDRVSLGNMGQTNDVGSGVHELKIDIGPGYRVYFGNDGKGSSFFSAAATSRPRQQTSRQPKRFGWTTKRGANEQMSKAAASHDDWLDTELANPEFAVHYLNEAFSGSKDEFLVALGNVVRARGGIQKMAAAIGKTRPALHRALTHGGNPGFDIVYAIMDELKFTPSFGSVAQATKTETVKPIRVRLARGGSKGRHSSAKAKRR